MHELLYGLFFGLSVGIVVGPISILCVRRTIADGFLMGIATGLGAASTHLIYGSITAFGFTAIQSFMFRYSLLLRILGGSYLIYLAFKAARQTISLGKKEYNSLTYTRALVSTFLLNMANPIVIASYAAFLSTFTITISTLGSGLGLISGIFLGDFSVFLAISFISHIVRSLGSVIILTWINRGAALLLATYGTIAISTSMYKLLAL